MSRSGYFDDAMPWEMIRWRGAVASAVRGKRGQALLRDLLRALDAMPKKRLIHGELIDSSGDVCALGAVCLHRNLPMDLLDSEDHELMSRTLNAAGALVREIEYENDEAFMGHEEPEQRWRRIRQWVSNRVEEK